MALDLVKPLQLGVARARRSLAGIGLWLRLGWTLVLRLQLGLGLRAAGTEFGRSWSGSEELGLVLV